MSRYRQIPGAVTDHIADVVARLSKLERTPQMTSTTIDHGSIRINAGELTVAGAPGSSVDTGYISMTGTADFGGDPTALLLITGRGGNTLLAFNAAPEDSATAIWAIADRRGTVGGKVLSDSFNGYGLDDPKLQVQWHNPTVFNSSTSGTFASIARMLWYPYHPNLRATCRVQSDAATTGEIEIVETGSGHVYDVQSFGAGVDQEIELIIRRTSMSTSQKTNGNQIELDIMYRRASGAGAVRANIKDIVGIDVSSVYP